MIKLSNGHEFEYMTASGALGFDVKGWPHEKPLIWCGFIDPSLFTNAIKTLTRHPREGNLRLWKPWTCVRTIVDGAVNKVGLTNPGIDYWCDYIAPTIDFDRVNVVGSLNGNKEELIYGIKRFNAFKFKAVKLNPSCPNTGHGMDEAEVVIDSVRACHEHSVHPLGVKLSVAQKYLDIEAGVRGYVEMIALNSVPWELVFPGVMSPLHKLEKRVKGGGGGVSGKAAQTHNWKAVSELATHGKTPVIAPSVVEYTDIERVRRLGAKAVSFGAIHLPSCFKKFPNLVKPWTIFTNPCKPTNFVNWGAERSQAAAFYEEYTPTTSVRVD